MRLVLVGVVIGIVASSLVALAVVSLRDGEPASGTSADGPAGTAATEPTEGGSGPIDPVEPSTEDEDEGGDEEATEEETSIPPAPASAGPAELPSGGSVTCSTPTHQVSSAEDLQAALDAAEPGDTIEIADGTYVGAFVLARSGTESAPISVCGSPDAILDGDGIKKGYAVHLKQVAHVRLVGFTVRNGQKGVMADGVSDSVIQGLTVTDIGDEAIHLRAASTGNAVLANTIRRTGLRRDKFGEGVYIGSARSNWPEHSGGEPDRSDNNLVQGNIISETSSEGIDIKEGTTGGRVIDNVIDGTGMTGADSLIDVKGNDWLIEGNTGRHGPEEGFQTHRILDGWGTGNTFVANTIDVDGEGNHVYIHDPSDTENVVRCDNRTASGGSIRANVDCA